MALLEHFRPPLSLSHPWRGFHSGWANAIAQQLNRNILPRRYYAIPNIDLGGSVEIDVATLREEGGSGEAEGAFVPWSPPDPVATIPVDFTKVDRVEVQVFYDEASPRLMAAVELVSPANKDRPAHRNAFAIKCASYLEQGIAVVVVDVVTGRRANMHAELLRVLELSTEPVWQSPTSLYAVAYRTFTAEDQAQLQFWLEALTVGGVLPCLPLWIGSDFSVPLDLEASYQATCESLRVHPPAAVGTPGPNGIQS